MSLFVKAKDILYRKQRSLELLAIFLLLSIIAFRFDNWHFRLLWSDYPTIAILLAFIISFIAILRIRLEKHRTHVLTSDLRKSASENAVRFESKLQELSARQKEVFNLIIKSKSNKEIMAELNIELSTLKTHINQIYKILGIKNRREAQRLDNQINT
ncbi:MAG: helix-turn-helix transcriptional regulator [Bacteroidetes bacterium]|nr:helix-turn-helix transcriptional regulator [Bacteroidota bacterium]